jgi:zinc protease
MFDLADKGGLADITAGMLLRGGGGQSAKDFREVVDQLGAKINIAIGWDSTDLTVTGPSYALEGVFDILGRMVISPAFDQKELDALKAERIEAAKQEQSSVLSRARNKAFEAVYGSHPYGRPLRGTPESIANITRADLLYFHNRFYLANNSELMISGEIGQEEVTRFARGKLGAWKKGDKVPATFRPPDAQASRQIFVIDQADSAQSLAVVAQMGISRREDDYIAAIVMFEVFKQRLTKYAESLSDVRIEANLDARFLAGPLMVTISAPATELAKAVEFVLAEMSQLQGGAALLDQVEGAKARAVSGLADRLAEADRLFDLILDIELYNLGRDYLVNFKDRVNAVTPADVQRVARNHLKPQSSVIVAAGSATRLEAMKSMGAVTVMP